MPEEYNGAVTNRNERHSGDKITFEVQGTVEKMIDASNQIIVVVGVKLEDEDWEF